MKDFFKLIHITKHPLTSWVALLLIAIAAYSIFKTDEIGVEAITLITIAIGLLGAKDPNKPNVGGAAAMLAVVCVLASGCVTNKKCIDKFGAATNTITIRDTVLVKIPVVVPGDSLTGEISKDSLAMLMAGVVDSLTAISGSKDLEIKFWKDKATGALKYKASKKANTVVVFKEVPVEVKGDCPPVVVASPPDLRWHEKFWKGFQFFSAFIVLGGLCLVILLLVFKRF